MARPQLMSTAQLMALTDDANQSGALVQDVTLDSSQDNLIVRTSQDLEPFVQHNREMQVHGHPGKLSKEMRKVATIPLLIVHKWMKEGFDVYTCSRKDLMKRLDDPQWRDFRTIGGRLS